MTPQEELAQYFEVCGYAPDDLISVGTRSGAEGDIRFTTIAVADAPRQIAARRPYNVWFGANPIRMPEPTPENPRPRGSVEDVVAVRALWADLDIKRGGMPKKDSATAVMKDVSNLLGVKPVAVVWSGHGFQPRWRIDIGELHSPERMAPVIEKFGRLVQLVAERHGGKADSVYDLARIIRAPHTTNTKPGMEPTPTKVWLYPDAGVLSFERLLEVLDEYVPDAPLAPVNASAQPVENRHVGTERGNAYVASALDYIRAELQGIKSWSVGETDDRGRGWEKIQADAALRLASLAKADWNGLTIERAQEIFVDNAPIDETWTIRDVVKKWKSQVGRAEPAAPPADTDDPLAGGGVAPHRSAADEAAIWSGDAGRPGDGAADEVDGEPAGDQSGPVAGDGAPAGDGVPWRKYAWTDRGNADRIAALFGDEIRYLPSLKRWVRYDDGAWRETETGGERAALELFDRLFELEGDLYSDVEYRKGKTVTSDRLDFGAWVRDQQSAARMKAAAQVVKYSGLLDAPVTDFDAHPMLLNAENGAIDLATGELIEHHPDLLLRRQIPVIYDADAKAPKWEAFLESVQPSPDMRDYLQRIVGYTLTGRTSEQVVFFHVGPPASGKSVFLEVLSSMMGELGRTIPPSTLLNKKQEQHPTDIMGMEGRRLLALDETPEGARLDESLVKRLSGESTITARGMGQDFRDFKIVGKVHLMTNHEPHISDDAAVHRRLHYIPWRHPVPLLERVQGLAEQIITEELEGVLAWAVRGTRRWIEDKLARPVEAEIARSDYIASEDEFAQFLEDELVVGAESFTESKVLFRRYVQWCEGQRMKPMSMVAFGRKLSSRGIEATRTKTTRGFKCALVVPQWVQQDPLG